MGSRGRGTVTKVNVVVLTATLVFIVCTIIAVPVALVCRHVSRTHCIRRNIIALFNVALPDILNFIHWAHNRKRGPLLFVCRDGYLLHKLYMRMYPTEPCQYIYSSRTALRTASRSYVQYMLSLQGTFVDVNGSNKTHSKFYERLGLPAAHKLLMTCYDCEAHMENLKYYHGTPLPCFHQAGYHGARADTLEFILRAPHQRVVDVRGTQINTWEPVYEDQGRNDDHWDDTMMPMLWKSYDACTRLARPGLRVFNEYSLGEQYDGFDIGRRYTAGVAALDLDGTTDCPASRHAVREMIRQLQEMRYFIVIITARTSPLHTPLDELGLHENVHVYFNTSQTDVAATKAQQLQMAFDRLPSPHKSRHCTFLLDDLPENIDAVRAAGFAGYLTNCTTIHKVVPWVRALLRRAANT